MHDEFCLSVKLGCRRPSRFDEKALTSVPRAAAGRRDRICLKGKPGSEFRRRIWYIIYRKGRFVKS
ncbi:hypothetical protein CLOM621_07832 [Clostridium sp. M62/1]|nr:hypothetical protein CLOM621_07832 [Clostridium sp. M62/1]